MLKFHNYDIVFREIPGEVTLAVNITNCPHRCKGCHSPHLTEDIGETLDKTTLAKILEKYRDAVTCVCFMGGDATPKEVEQLAIFIRETTENCLKTAWYSGKQNFPVMCSSRNFDYIKLGPYIESLGGLDSPKTNQRFYRIENEKMIDMTECFYK